jgi:CRISPR-associated endonuclease Cas1/CRISPR-associated protein Cas4
MPPRKLVQIEEAPELLPLRAVNEFVYCPRLFFIEHVERQFEDSHDTVDGDRVHRKVDQPRGEIDEGQLEAALEMTSVELSSASLGIVGKIDMVRSDGKTVVPIDFKRGRLPPPEVVAYEPERVQVTLQALLLRESGYACSEAKIYYAASKKYVTLPIDAEAEAMALEAVVGARLASQSTTLPPPLVDSPKCPRCSLNSICLPDETNLLVGASTEPVRPFAAPLDHARPLYVLSAGARVGLSGEVLQVKAPEGEVIAESRLIETASVSLFGNVQISSQASRAVLSRDIPIFFLSFGGWLTGYARSIDDHSLDLREAQINLGADARLRISRKIVEGKVRNQRTMVRRSLGPSSRRVLQALALCLERIKRAATVDELLGLEGRSAQLYFRAFGQMLDEDRGFDFRGRHRRPPRDPVNALLSFGYAMLTKEALASVISVGFEPGLGVFHVRRPGRPSLALDLMEEFRPLIVDSTVMSLINTREIRDIHFIRRGLGTALTDDGRRTFIRAFERRLQSTATHPIFGYEASYRRALWMQARLLARAVQGDIPEYPAFVTR